MSTKLRTLAGSLHTRWGRNRLEKRSRGEGASGRKAGSDHSHVDSVDLGDGSKVWPVKFER